MTKSGQAELANRIEGGALLSDAGKGLRWAIDLLERRAGVMSADLLPYSLQVTILAVLFATGEANDDWETAAEKWFWRTGWAESFASASYRHVAEQTANLRRAFAGEEAEWRFSGALPGRFDFRSARARLFTLRIARLTSLYDLRGRPANGRELLSTYGRAAMVRLFPMPRNASPQLKQLIQGVGNRFLVNPFDDVAVRDRLLQGPDLALDVLNSLFVTEQDIQRLRLGDLEEFLKARTKRLMDWDHEQWQSEFRDNLLLAR